MRSFFAALRFLTPLPVPESWCGGEEDLRLAAAFFPWVGVLIGGVAVALLLGLDRVLPQLPASTLVVVALTAASRGLHIDGLADTADGLFSSKSRERSLEIMRDSWTGAMGVVAIVCVVLLKVVLLAAVAGSLRWRAAFLMPVAGRCALLTVMTAFPYARPEGGLATVFHVSRGRSRLLLAWALVALIAAGWAAASWAGLVSGAASFALALLLGFYYLRRIRGYTGDTLGATCEIVELVPALVMAIRI